MTHTILGMNLFLCLFSIFLGLWVCELKELGFIIQTVVFNFPGMGKLYVWESYIYCNEMGVP